MTTTTERNVMNKHDDMLPEDLTPEQKEAVEKNIQKTLARINKAKTIWKKIKTPLVIAGAATGGFILRGALSEPEECPYAGEIEAAEDQDVNLIEQE